MSAVEVQAAAPVLWAGPVPDVLCQQHLPAEVLALVERQPAQVYLIVDDEEWFLQSGADKRMYASLYNKRMACGVCGAR